MPSLDSVFAHIEHHRVAFLERLFAYLRMPSISAHGLGVRKTAEYLESLLETLSFEVAVHETEGWPIILARHGNRPDRRTALFYGHYDVQPPDPLDAWTSPPFEPAIRDGRIYARGVGDNKGQHFANLLAVESLLACGGPLPCNLIFLLEGEEEVGSPHIAEFVRTHRDELACDLAITSDGPVHESGRATIVFGVRGVASFELRAHGATQDVHSGNWGGIVPNPLWTLVHLLSRMKNQAGEITIPGFYDDIIPPTPEERAALASLPYDPSAIAEQLGVGTLDAPADRPVADRLALWPTFTINGLHGGYAGPGSKTVLPCHASAKCDMRLVNGQTRDGALDLVESFVREQAPDVEFIRLGGMDPSKTPLDSPYSDPLRQAVRIAQGEDPLLVPALGGTLPNYVFTGILGVHSFVIPYANPDESNHAPNENLELERFFKGIRTGAALLTQLGAL